jgi:hypothetical protein
VAGTIQPYELNHPVERYEALKIRSPSHCPRHPLFLPTACTANVMYRADVFQKVGLLLNRSGGEETDLNWRMQTQTDYKICFLQSGGLVYHRYRQDLKAFCRSQHYKACTLVDLHRRWQLRVPTGRKELLRTALAIFSFLPTILAQALQHPTQGWRSPKTLGQVLSDSCWEAYLNVLVPWIRFRGIRAGLNQPPIAVDRDPYPTPTV